MAEEQQQHSWTCTLCGSRKSGYSYYHDSKDESLYLCTDCLKSVSRSVSRDLLDNMTAKQLKRHMEVRDKLAATYKNSFAATKTFYVGKKRKVPIIEVDEKQELWALPKAPMPLAQPISSIVDCKLILSSDELDADDEMMGELFEDQDLKDLKEALPFLRGFISKLYKSKHTDLAPIPEGHLVDYLYMVLTLDDQESGLPMADIDLLPFWLALPSRVDAGYDCTYEFITFLKQLAHKDYEKRRALEGKSSLVCIDWLSNFVACGQIAPYDADILSYYLERVLLCGDKKALSSPYNLVKTTADTVASHILSGEKVPEWQTQHTVGVDTFLSAFYRYAPGLSLHDVVYIMDQTGIQSGKGGILLAQDSFAVDSFSSSSKESGNLSQPIAYDDLLFVDVGDDKGKLILAYQDGRRVVVNGGAYAHYLFATINCILFLRSSECGMGTGERSS